MFTPRITANVALSTALTMTGWVAFFAIVVAGIVLITVYGDGGPATYFGISILLVIVIVIGLLVFVVRPLIGRLAKLDGG